MAGLVTDITLLEGQVLATALDFCLDAGEVRRSENSNKNRRALVHDHEDGLTINWANDYPGGVKVNGLKKLVGSPSGAELLFTGPVTIQGTIKLIKNVKTAVGTEGDGPFHAVNVYTLEITDLIEEIIQMKNDIKTQNKKIIELETKVNGN